MYVQYKRIRYRSFVKHIIIITLHFVCEFGPGFDFTPTEIKRHFTLEATTTVNFAIPCCTHAHEHTNSHCLVFLLLPLVVCCSQYTFVCVYVFVWYADDEHQNSMVSMKNKQKKVRILYIIDINKSSIDIPNKLLMRICSAEKLHYFLLLFFVVIAVVCRCLIIHFLYQFYFYL